MKKIKLEELASFAREMWESVENEVSERAIMIALEGPLGVGKTTLTKELAKIMGIKSEVASPTFILHMPYIITQNSKLKSQNFHHIDCWRMDEFGELEQIGLESMIAEKAVIVIEWADKFRNEILEMRNEKKVKIIWIKLEYGEGESERKVSVTHP